MQPLSSFFRKLPFTFLLAFTLILIGSLVFTAPGFQAGFSEGQESPLKSLGELGRGLEDSKRPGAGSSDNPNNVTLAATDRGVFSISTQQQANPTVAISGTVRKPDTNALAGATVLFIALNPQSSPTLGFTTNNQGQYSGNIPEGPNFDVDVIAPRPNVNPTLRVPFIALINASGGAITKGGQTLPNNVLDIAMVPGVPVQGNVSDQNNVGIPDFFVLLKGQNDQGQFTAQKSITISEGGAAAGNFTLAAPQTSATYQVSLAKTFITNVAAASGVVGFDLPSPTSVTVTQTDSTFTKNPSFLLIKVTAGISLVGKVRDKNNVGIANVFVQAFDAATEFGAPVGNASTGSDGSFSISVPSTTANYRLEAFPDPSLGFTVPPPRFASVAPDAQGNLVQSPAQVVFTLGGGTLLKGSVKKSDGTAVTQGVFVSVDREGGQPAGGGPLDSQGKFSVAVPQTSASYLVRLFVTDTTALAGQSPPSPQRVVITESQGVFSQTPTESNLVLRFTEGASITGSVKRNGTGVAGVFVAGFPAGPRTGPPPFGTSSDSNGNFSLSVPKSSASYQLEVFIPPGAAVDVVPPPPTPVSITVSDGQVTQNPATLVITVQAGFSVKGKVLRSDGTGVSGVFVDFRDPKTGIGSGGGTDSQGNFSVSVPQTAATYRAQVFVPPGAEALAPPPAQTVTVTVVAGQLTQSPTQENLVFTLGAAFAITGKVQAAGQGVAGVFVAAFATPRTGFGPPNFGAQTNQEGQFSVAVPQSAATYELEVFFDPNNPALAGLVRPATPTRVEVTVTAGTASQNPTAANLIITLGAGFTVKGKVVKSDGTTGVANVFVQLFQRGQLGGMPAGAPTGSNGNFSIAVPQTAAVYEIRIFMPPEVTGLAPPPPTTVTVSEVTPGQLSQSPSESQLVITLGAGFSLTGSVVDSSNNGIPNVFVAVAPIGQFGPSPFGNITESNGSFSVSIPKSVATYEVQVFVPPQFGGSALVPPPPTKVTISEPTTGTFTQSPLPLVITMGAGFAVKGKVVKSDNSPVANVFVGLRKRGGGFGPPLGAPTQSDGTFSINVPQTAAKYDLEVFVPPEAGTLAPPPPTQVTVDVVGSQLTQSPSQANLVIVLGAGFELKGRVVDSNNNGVANLFVAVFIGGGRFGPPAFGDLTGPNGDFSIAAPRTAASYELQVFVPPGTTAGLVPPKATVVKVTEPTSGTFSQVPDPLVITMGAGFAVKGSVKKSNGDPVRDVFVALHRFGEFGPPLGGPTDGEGKFSIAVPQTAAVYEVTVFLPPEAAANLAPPPPTKVTVAVVNNQLTQSPSESQLVITLGAGFSLKGTVKGANGSGIADVFVAAFVGAGRTGPPPFGNVTIFDGSFSISVPDSTATYQLEVFLPPGTTTALVPPAPTVVKVTKGTPTTQSPVPLVITLGGGFSVKGSVKTSGGTGIPDIFVNLIPKGEAPGGPLLGTLTDIAGNFSISVPQTSKTYTAQVFLPFKEVGNLAPPPPTDVRVIETTGTFSQSPDPLNLIVAAGLSLTGSVVDPNNVGVPNVFVAAFTSSGRTGPPPFGNITDSSGAFSIAIPQTSRTYELEVFLPPGATTALVPPGVTKVTITQSGSTFTQNPSPLKITMSTGFSIKGKVVDGGGSGVNGVFVNLVRKGVLVPGPPLGAPSDSDGKFSIAVPQTAATYTTQVFVPPHLGANIAPPPPVDVVVSKTNNTFSQSPTEDNLVLTLQTGFQIKGSVIRSDNNTGLENVFVGLFVGSARTGPPPFGDLTDSGGKFAIAVPTTPQTYEAEAFLPPDSPLLGQLTRPAAREVTVTVTGGTASQNPTEANLVLAFGAGSAIKGSVTGLGDTDAFVEFARVGGSPADRFGGSVEDDGTFSVAVPNTSATYQGQVFLLNPTATQSPPPPRVVEVTFVNNVFSQSPTQANLVFAVATGIPVTVTVLANNSPVSDVFVNVQNTGTNESLGGVTDSKGKITLSVPDRAATWSVSLILNTAQFATPVPQTFTVANSVATPNSITFNLVSGVQITGSVKQGTTGIQGAFVNFSDTQTATRQFGTATDKNGNFSIALPTTDATYQASVFLPPGLNLVRPDPVSVVVSATSATPSTINFAVSPGILYTGVVQKTDTTPVFGVFVELVAASNGKKFGGVSLGNGKFSIALPTGNDTYTVNVFVPSALGLTAQAAGPVTVTAGTPSPSTLTITLQ